MNRLLILVLVSACGGTVGDSNETTDAPRNECEEMAARGCAAVWECDQAPMLCYESKIGNICTNIGHDNCFDKVAGLVNCYEAQVSKLLAEETGNLWEFDCDYIADDLTGCADTVVVYTYCQFGQ
jgi:hypothetical protein